MPTVFDWLDELERRPEMYLGWGSAQRGEQLRDLECMLLGYAHATALHNLDDPGGGFMGQFGAYLRRRFGWSASAGPIKEIRAHSTDDDAAWRLFWSLLRDFRGELSAALVKSAAKALASAASRPGGLSAPATSDQGGPSAASGSLAGGRDEADAGDGARMTPRPPRPPRC